jgi:hypothetical protein
LARNIRTKSFNEKGRKSTMIKLLRLTKEVRDDLWNNIRKIPQELEDFAKGNKSIFWFKITQPGIFLLLGENGMFSMSNLSCLPDTQPFSGSVCFSFWEDTMWEKPEFGKAAIEYVFDSLKKLHRLTAFVSIENKKLASYLKELGFITEGILKDFSLLIDEPITIKAMRLLRSEYEKNIKRDST